MRPIQPCGHLGSASLRSLFTCGSWKWAFPKEFYGAVRKPSLLFIPAVLLIHQLHSKYYEIVWASLHL